MLTVAAHLFAHVVGAVLVPRVGRAFCAAVKHFPPAFAAVALAGMSLGAWLVTVCWPGDPAMAALGVFVLAGYTAALGFLACKLWDGTWAAFCDRVAAEFD